ncbi:MAG: hypothetical protein LCI00_24155 [Chloroflexi bacterium]|nr:hypothetical protein [Chloroflexota bacterium]MCC6895879.1 hypothetical protein [Anaerolineae bacterium]
MNVHELLANYENYLDQIVTLEGVLVVEVGGNKSWSLIENYSTLSESRERLCLIRPSHDSILAMGFSQTPSAHSNIPYDPTNSLFNYRFFDQVTMVGRLIKSELCLAGFALEIYQAKFFRERYQCYAVNRVLELQEIEMSLMEVTSLDDNVDELLQLPNTPVRLSGVLVGNYLLDLFYVTDFGSARTLKKIQDKTVQSKSISINDKLFIEKLKRTISAGVGTELMYLDRIHLIGEIKQSNQPEFPAIITNITEATMAAGLTIFHFTKETD